MTSCAYNYHLEVSETLDLGLDLPSDPNVNHKIGGNSGVADGTTTPAVTKVWSDTIQLAGGAATIDLTALARGNLGDETFTGLKLQHIKWQARSTNTDGIVIADGATNGINIFGDASGQVTLLPGQVLQMDQADQGQDVGASDKTIDLSSSDLDAIIDVLLTAG